MLYFFRVTQANKYVDDAMEMNKYGLTHRRLGGGLPIRRGYRVKIGLRGSGGYSRQRLDLRVSRNGIWASGSPSSPVQLTRMVDDTNRVIQVYNITGLRDGDKLVGVLSANTSLQGKDYPIKMSKEIPVYEIQNTPSGLMQEAAAFPETFLPGNRRICPFAVSYLALSDKVMGGMAVLDDANIGGPLGIVHGLSVHTTAGRADRSPYTMARWGCVEPWNRQGHKASAHFGVAGDGTLVQFVPANFVAHAQYSPGNEHWISVEVDNDGTVPMNDRQLASVKKLFGWVCDTFGVPRQLATGCLFQKRPHFDKLTAEVCHRGTTTTDPYEACMSRGLSCHWWLEGNKTANSHACPGPGILKQLDAVAR